MANGFLRLAVCGLVLAAACSASSDRDAGLAASRVTTGSALTSGYTVTTHTSHQVARAVALPDGRVVVADGEGAEVYSPSTNTWTATGPATAPWRWSNALVLLADGRVLSVGGSPSSAASELLDPATLTWTAAAPMNVGREAPASVRLSDGRVLVVGGTYDAAATAEIYDPSANTWTLVGPPKIWHAEDGIAILLEDGRVLISGYHQPELFDPATGQFTPVGDAGQSRPHGGGVRLPSGKVLLFGGYKADCQLFDPATDTFQVTGALASPIRWNAAWAVRPDGEVVVAGGDTMAGQTLGTVERYDPAVGAWSPAPSLLVAREDAAMATLPNGRVLVVGGSNRLPPPDQNTFSVINAAVAAEVIDPGPCLPATCADLGASCGTVEDGCGGTISCGGCGEGLVCAPNGSACVPEPQSAVLDPGLHVPACMKPAPSCDSGDLLVGRGPLGPEANAPNVLLAGCPDGSGGTFHTDESLDRLRVSTLDGGPLRPGATVRVEATVWPYVGGYAGDYLDLYYAPSAASPTWTLIGTLSPTQPGPQVLAATTVLGAGPRQVVRGQFRYGGSASPDCVAGSYNDRDDLVFAVDSPSDAAPPSVGITAPKPDAGTLGGDVLLQAMATDDVGVDRVEWYVFRTTASPPATPVLVGTSKVAPYSVTWNSRPFSLYFEVGYTIVAHAYDAAGREATASRQVMLDNAGPALSVTGPLPNTTVSGTVTIVAAASDYSGVASVSFYDGTILIGTDDAAPYQAAWTPSAGGAHTLRVVAVDGRGNSTQVSVPVTVLGPTPIPTATYNATARAPECTAAGAGCDSGLLLMGRGPVGPETNAPNTVGPTCADGVAGVFHSDESLDALRIEPAVAGGSVRAGATVKVTATVWSYTPTSDVLDVFYAPNAAAPVWTFVGTAPATASHAAESLTLTFPLATTGATRQAIRGVFRYGGSRGTCPAGGYDDKDDLVFAVKP